MSKNNTIKLTPGENLKNVSGRDDDIMCVQSSDGWRSYNPIHFRIEITRHGWIRVEPRMRHAKKKAQA